MKKLLLIVTVLLLTGCQNKRIEELENEVEKLKNLNSEYEELISSSESNVTALTDELESSAELLEVCNYEVELMTYKINELPYYINDAIEESLVTSYVPKPNNSFLLFKEGWYVGGYKVFSSEEGMCELAIVWTLYETEAKEYNYITNGGCNPNWIHSTPIYLEIGNSLYSISDALYSGYIDEQDLEKAPYIYSEDK